MPSVDRYYDVNSKESKDIEDEFAKEQAMRKAAINAQTAYYEGAHREWLKPDRSKVNDNVIVNLCGLIIEKGVSNLFGTDEIGETGGVEFEVTQEKEAAKPKPSGLQGIVQNITGPIRKAMGMQEPDEPETPMQDWLDGFWEQNKQNILLHDIGLNGGIAGHAFAKIVPPVGEQEYPRLINLDPLNCSVFWDENDVDKVLWYRIQYDGIKSIRREDTVRDDSGQSWTVITYQREKNKSNAKWIELNRQSWPYEWAPIVDWKNQPFPNKYYGKGDLGSGGRINDALNFIMSNVQRILKLHANPKTIGTGFAAGELKEADVSGLWVIDNPEATVTNLEMQSDLASSMAFANMMRDAMFANARELDPHTVQDRLGDLTNFGLRVLFKDVLGKNTTKRFHYGDALRRICCYALALGGMPDADIAVVWPDPLPSDPLPTAQALQIDVAVGGLSKKTYLQRRGYDAEQERERNAEEDALNQHNAAMTGQAQTAGNLGMLGQMIDKLRGGNAGDIGPKPPPQAGQNNQPPGGANGYSPGG